MKKITALALSSLLFVSLALAGEPNEVDQKWLKAVEQKVTSGDTSVTTPSQERVDLLKTWAAKNGYSVTVNKLDRGFQLSVNKNLARK